MASSSLNYISCLEDEIALEGLDGITLQALWVRLKQRPNFETCLQLDDHSKAFLWDLICGNEEIFMYELPTSREMLVIFNRYEHMDPELGIVLEPKDVPHDIYPFHPVDDEKNGVRGSCKLYYERVDITDSVVVKSLQQVEEEYGEKMVLVASQRLRDKALNVSTCIDKFYDLTLTQYILLERIGRSRQMLLSRVKVSLAAMGDNPKSMFYHRKRLLKLNLITKQPHQQKGCRGQTQNGSLLHLTRFYVERRSKFIMMIQRAVEILKSKPGNCAPYTVVKEEMGMPETSCRKLFKSLEFQRYIKNVNSPYRRIYPDASPSQWRCKGKDAERYIRIMELVNPGIDPQEVCKVDDIADDDEDEDSYPGILDQKKVVWKVGLLQQAYEIVEEAGPDGVSQSDMARFLGQAKLDSRTICRNLQRRNSVHSLMKDVGRQRVSRYVSNKYARTGHLTQEFRKEREKMMAMIEESRAQEAAPSTSQQDEVMKIVESNSMEGVEVDLEMVPYVTKKSEVQALCSPGGDGTCGIAEEQKKQLPDEPPKKKNQGFLTMLEEIQLTYSNQKRNSPHVTTRMMKRANMIIENVRSIKVIDDAFKLQKMIVKAESEEGYPVKMDKKSLNRLLDRLARGGFLKNIIVKLKCGDNIKLVPFVVDPSITFESPHLKSAIEQQKLKFLAHKAEPKKESEGGLITSSREQKKANSDPDVPGHSKSDKKINVNPMDQTSVGASMQELKQMHQVTAKQELSISKEKSPEASTSEGPKKVLPSRASLGPKFVRMCELHKLLFYIVYGYCGHEDLDQEKAWEAISKSSPEAQLHDEDLSSYPTIFSPEISWKDNGSIPGDGRGAGGLDSAMFAHLKRNWSSNSGHSAAARPSALVAPTADGGEKTYEGSMSYSQYLMNTTTPSSDTLSPKHRLAGLRNVKLSVYKPRMGTDGKTLEIPVGMVGEASKGRKRKREQSSVRDPLASKHSRVSSQKRIKPDSYQRDIKMRKRSPKKPYYDEEDRAALRRMNKLRVDWSSAEDSFLLLCKVASCFLFPNKRSQMITFSLVRDMLHKRFPEARNKTSRACQRRINYIMKNPTTEDNVAIFLEEVKQDPKIVQDFKGPRLPRNKKNIENIYANMFQSLMQRLVIKFGSSESRQCPDLPDTIEEFEERFRIIVASPSLRSKLRCREVQSVPDIDFYVVNALIYSSLCSKYDRDSYAYQLYLAYQQYPQSLLNSVLTHMRQDQMISYKKCYNRSLFTQTCLPLSTSPFQLSVTYLHVFNFKYQYEIFHQAWDMLKRMYDKEVTLLNKLIPSLKSQSKETTSIIKPASLEMSTVIADDKNPEDENDISEKGVPVVILHEGGYCATIVALLATKRLIFDIVIPEQIIMMDQQQQPLLDDQPQSLLRRFSSHTEMSGRNISDPRDPLNETEQQFPSTESPVTFHILEDVNKEVSKKERNSVGSKDQNISEGMVSEEVMKGSRDFRRPGKRKAIGKDVMKVKKSKVKHEELEQVDVSHTATSLREIEASSLEIDMMHINQSVKSGKLIKCKPFDEGTLLKNDIEFEKVEVENAEDFSSQELGDSSQPGELSSTEGEDSEAAIASGRGNLPSASRLGLYMMRDQLSRAEVDQINIQHAQEHLVVNACDVTCRLRPPPELQESFEIVVPEKPELIENYLLPLTMQRVSECLEHRKKVILKEWSTLNEVLSLWKKEGKRETLLQLVKETYDYIHSCKELGASVWELKEKFSIPGVLNIMLVVNMMEEARLLLRVGVALVRWVTMPHTKPWLIHTNKITRYSRQNIRLQGVYRMNVSNESVSPAEKQQLGSNADSGEDCVKVDDQGGVKHHKMDIQLQDCQTQMSSDCTQDSHHSISSVVEDTTLPLGGSSSKESDSKEVTSTVRHIHSHLAMCKRKYKCDEEVSQEMERTIKHHESMDYEQISVAVRPFVRLDGTLNRRVLDRLLGAVLSLIMERPGISGRDIVCRFSPALQPAHTHDLLETLVQLECIIREELIQSHKVSLFSDTVEYNLVPADIHDCDDDLIYEPAVDAIIKMAMFIGDKKYSQDFLSGDSR
ncbi:LOW QUALITY PROTEIN: general transcription factor 3C polypeptide 1 [Macrobrachium rosenbergii]|uniref:LOW QUALITY PROTEIN: general transcription factor 3C polypeptide 1 n=1 Tax=Macrobrachium rosenbergii TaxID=79674 RepID=UPI0034D619F1